MAITITLGGIQLPTHMEWVDQFKYNQVSQVLRYTVANTLVRKEQVRVGGRPITLVATEKSGWVHTDDRDAILAIYELANQAYTFNYRDEFIATVAFRYSDPPALDLDYLVGGAGPSEYLTGQIKLITLE